MYCLFFSERFDLKPDYSDWHNTAIATATIGFTGFAAIGFAAIGFTGFAAIGFTGFAAIGFTGFAAIGSIGSIGFFRHGFGL
jgi:hypothetical protein